MVSEEILKTLQECIFLAEQGLNRFGSYQELARRMCHGHDNALLASRLERLGDEHPTEMSLAPLLTLKDQLLTVLR